MEIVINYEDQDNRILSEPFMKLPSKKELPDYYEVIRRPVDISKILGKIEEEKVKVFCNSFTHMCIKYFFLLHLQYDSLDGLEKDFLLLVANTQRYNEDGSLIYEDSIVLESVFISARARLEEDDGDDDEDEPSGTATPSGEGDPATPGSSGGRGTASTRKRRARSDGRGGKKKRPKYVSDDEDDDDQDDDDQDDMV